jgi:hypothetical protein
MKPTQLRVALVAVAALSIVPMTASAFDYNYVEGGYLHRDNSFSDDGGFRIGGSFGVLPQIAAFAEYGNTNSFDQFTAGALFHTPINEVLDFNAGASLENYNGHGHNDTGFGLRGGVRWNIIPGQWELNPELRYVHVSGDNATSARLGALYHINQNFSLNAALQGGDDDRVEAGVRYSF